MTTAELILAFKADVAYLSSSDVFEKYIAPTQCSGFSNEPLDHLRERIADQFGISMSSIVVVGSAKLGFTLKPGKRYSAFSSASDVDIAIVSDVVFDDIWKQSLDYWHQSGYSKSEDIWSEGKRFRNYVFRGWMRPDMLPSGGSYTYRNDWFDFFQGLTSERLIGDYKITAGVYRETHFLRAYQKILIDDCAQELRIST